MTRANIGHIILDDEGRPWIEGANTKVVEVVLDKRAYGWSPEEIHLQHQHLSLAQIHAAFAYYYDHQQEIDRAIEDIERDYIDARSANPNPRTRTELADRRAAESAGRKSA